MFKLKEYAKSDYWSFAFTLSNPGAYCIDGKVFWEWISMPDIDNGKPFKSCFTNYESRIPVTFPYVVPEKPEYVFRPTEQFSNEELG